jgi:hypothetical protein
VGPLQNLKEEHAIDNFLALCVRGTVIAFMSLSIMRHPSNDQDIFQRFQLSLLEKSIPCKELQSFTFWKHQK